MPPTSIGTTLSVLRFFITFGFVSAGLLLLAEDAPNKEAPLPAEEARIVVKVSDAYYKQVAVFLSKEREVEERYKTVRLDRLKLDVAKGRVVNRRGMPIENAVVTIEKDRKVIGRGKTDPDGSFSVKLDQEYTEVTLEVIKSGFKRWAICGSPEGIVDRLVCLESEITREYLEGAIAAKGLDERLWRVLEILHGGESVFASIGDLRPDLLRIVRSGAFEKLDSRYESPASRALYLLILWQEPLDQQLLDQEFQKALEAEKADNFFFRARLMSLLPKEGISGANIDEVVKRGMTGIVSSKSWVTGVPRIPSGNLSWIDLSYTPT